MRLDGDVIVGFIWTFGLMEHSDGEGLCSEGIAI